MSAEPARLRRLDGLQLSSHDTTCEGLPSIARIYQVCVDAMRGWRVPTGEGPMGLGYFRGKDPPACSARPSEAPHDGQQPKFLLLSTWSSGLLHGRGGGLEVGRFEDSLLCGWNSVLYIPSGGSLLLSKDHRLLANHHAESGLGGTHALQTA